LNTYEGMYIFDPAAAADWAGVEAEVRRLMERAGAELLVCHRWDDRRLAYEINGHKRGCYVLTYFKAPGQSLGSLSRDAQLSDKILRALFLRVDGMTREQMESPPAPGSDSPRARGGDRWEREDRERSGRRRGRDFHGRSRPEGPEAETEDDRKRRGGGLHETGETATEPSDDA